VTSTPSSGSTASGAGTAADRYRHPAGTLDAWQLAGVIRRAATTSRLRVTANGSLVWVRFGGRWTSNL